MSLRTLWQNLRDNDTGDNLMTAGLECRQTPVLTPVSSDEKLHNAHIKRNTALAMYRS